MKCVCVCQHSISDSGKKRRASEKRKAIKNHSPSLERDSSASETSAPRGKRTAKKADDEESSERKLNRLKEKAAAAAAEVEDDGGDVAGDARSENNEYTVEPMSPQPGNKGARNVRSAVLSIDRAKGRAHSKQTESEDGAVSSSTF